MGFAESAAAAAPPADVLLVCDYMLRAPGTDKVVLSLLVTEDGMPAWTYLVAPLALSGDGGCSA